MRRQPHVAEVVDVDDGTYEWSCSCGAYSSRSYDDEGDAVDDLLRHEREPG